MQNIIKTHLKKYPLSQPEDVIKLLFQSEFGGGHLIPNEKIAKIRLSEERKTVPLSPFSLPEEVGGGFWRLPLSMPMVDDTIFQIFLLSAKKTGTFEGFQKKTEYLKQHFPHFYSEEIIQRIFNGEIPRHSEIYRRAYRPAYRIVTNNFAKYFQIFCRIDALTGSKHIAIDGQAAAGKTTLAQNIAEVYQPCANLFHMDDYFLPPEKTTAARLQQPGGNVDYERFQGEVLDNLSEDNFTYFPYDCKTQRKKSGVTVKKKQINIIEGAYALHPYFKQKYDLSVCLKISPERQRERIIKRNPNLAEKFFRLWIPLENQYFEICRPQADLTYFTE